MMTPLEVLCHCEDLEKRLSAENRAMTDREVNHLLSLLDVDTPHQWYLRGESFGSMGDALSSVGGLLRYGGSGSKYASPISFTGLL